jgi:hypothetical protein
MPDLDLMAARVDDAFKELLGAARDEQTPETQTATGR